MATHLRVNLGIAAMKNHTQTWGERRAIKYMANHIWSSSCNYYDQFKKSFHQLANDEDGKTYTLNIKTMKPSIIVETTILHIFYAVGMARYRFDRAEQENMRSERFEYYLLIALEKKLKKYIRTMNRSLSDMLKERAAEWRNFDPAVREHGKATQLVYMFIKTQLNSVGIVHPRGIIMNLGLELILAASIRFMDTCEPCWELYSPH